MARPRRRAPAAHRRHGEKPSDAPSDAIVLFDGKDLSKWKTTKGEDCQWKIENGYAEVAPKTGDAITKDEFGPDFQLHLEFARVAKPADAPDLGLPKSKRVFVVL